MSHGSFSSVIIAIVLFIIALTLLLLFYQKRKRSGVKALDYIIWIFFGVSLLSALAVVEFYLHNSWVIFGGPDPLSGGKVSNFTNILVVVQFLLNLYIYYIAESFLQPRPHLHRLFVVSFLSGIICVLSFYFLTTGVRIQTTDIIGFASATSGLDSLVFDLLQLFIISQLAYVYILQFRFVANKQIRKYIAILLISIGLYLLGSILELLEHFNFPEVDGNIAAILTFLVLAAFYSKYPNFIYLTPANISFIQVVTKTGITLYKAEIERQPEKEMVQLVGPALSAINQLVSEFVQDTTSSRDTDITNIGYGNGVIMFETAGKIRVILQTDRSTAILRRSLRYFVEEFNRTFEASIGEAGGIIDPAQYNVAPEEIFVKCIPIVSSKSVISQYAE